MDTWRSRVPICQMIRSSSGAEKTPHRTYTSRGGEHSDSGLFGPAEARLLPHSLLRRGRRDRLSREDAPVPPNPHLVVRRDKTRRRWVLLLRHSGGWGGRRRRRAQADALRRRGGGGGGGGLLGQRGGGGEGWAARLRLGASVRSPRRPLRKR